MRSVPAYFSRQSLTTFQATEHTGGAWDPDQIHIAPVMGLAAHAIQLDHAARRPDPLSLTRFSADILGTMPAAETLTVTVRVLRPGRTIELVEASVAHDGRTAVIARAWLQQQYDTSSVAWSALPPIPDPDALDPFRPDAGWPGSFAATIEGRRRMVEPGRGQVWLRLGMPLLDDESVSPVAQLLSVADIVNGMTPRLGPTQASYPNLDLTVHVFRQPASEWIGFDTQVSIGADGVGLTRAALYDLNGPIGTSAQTLTVRLQD